jgi:hypothetical protein
VLVERLGEFYTARRVRHNCATDAIPSQILAVSGIVGLITLIFGLLYGANHKTMHFVLTSFMAVAMAITYSLVLVLDSPYQGDFVVSNQPYLYVIESIERNNLFFNKR